ncbi:MAG: 4,5-DOPA dioxygenase extradiol [Actinomycetota bacterium]
MASTAAFLGHGSPMNALEHNRYTQSWASFGDAQPKPQAVLSISAHWYINQVAVTAMQNPRTIYDFGGFPQELFQYEYPVAGSPEVAQRVADLLPQHTIVMDQSQWGIDHGTWSVLCHVFPQADVPVVQLSINANLSPQQHVEIGRLLAPLLDADIMVIGSGNIVHNLGIIDWGAHGKGAVWAEEFDAEARRILTGKNPSDIISLLDHPNARKAVPTAEHFLPVAYIAGLAQARGKSLEVLVGGCELGSLSMTSYVLS